jgi:hypothetical protein
MTKLFTMLFLQGRRRAEVESKLPEETSKKVVIYNSHSTAYQSVECQKTIPTP